MDNLETLTYEEYDQLFNEFYSQVKAKTELKKKMNCQTYTKKELALIMIKDSKFYYEGMPHLNKLINRMVNKPTSFFIRHFRAYGYNISYMVNDVFIVKS